MNSYDGSDENSRSGSVNDVVDNDDDDYNDDDNSDDDSDNESLMLVDHPSS
jgi:hypothetical protein